MSRNPGRPYADFHLVRKHLGQFGDDILTEFSRYDKVCGKILFGAYSFPSGFHDSIRITGDQIVSIRTCGLVDPDSLGDTDKGKNIISLYRIAAFCNFI